METKFIVTTCEFMLHEDDWNKGEGKLISRWDEADYIKESKSIKDLLEQVNYLDRDFFGKKPINEVFENDPCHDKEHGRFDADLMVDLDDNDDNSIIYEKIIKPTEEKYKRFERGEVKLYALHITVYVKKIVELDEADLADEGWNTHT